MAQDFCLTQRNKNRTLKVEKTSMEAVAPLNKGQDDEDEKQLKSMQQYILMLKKKLVQTNAEIEIIKSFKSNHHQIVLFQRAWASEAELRISPYQPDAMEEKTWDFFNYSFAKKLEKAGIKDRLKYMEKLLAARTKSAARAKKEKTE